MAGRDREGAADSRPAGTGAMMEERGNTEWALGKGERVMQRERGSRDNTEDV